ncbi:MAG: SMI1/KNR4 family protein [Rhodospirillales bacterium]|nr:SMI1/KNR4 family protein [Rhodospirillales bacterium]
MASEPVRQRIRDFQDKECGKGARSEDIENAETQLGVRFPTSYRRYLEDFGWARFSHHELYGLGQDVPMHLDLVRNTAAERTQMRPLMPPALVPIMNDGAGNHYCLDISQSTGDECPIVFWDHDLGESQKAEPVSPTFAVWIVDLLDRLEADSGLSP